MSFRESLVSMNEIDTHIHTSSLVSSSSISGGCPQNLSHVESPAEHVKWYVMRSTYSREMKAKEHLETNGIECYVPVRREHHEDGDVFLPVIHNYLFVHTSRSVMDPLKRQMEETCPLRYAMDKSLGMPMVVSDKAMQDFIRVTRDADSDVLYLDNPNVAVTKGKSVEIVAGPYKGIRGKILRILRDRKVVVSISDIVAVALSGIPFAWMKEI